MSFWLPIVHNGARVCGLRENRQLNLEMGKLGPLDDAPGVDLKPLFLRLSS